MKTLIRLLLLLGIVAQGLLINSYRHDLLALARGRTGLLPPSLLPLFVTPIVLGVAGAMAAGALRRRRSAWAWPVAVIPLLILLLWYAAALYVTLNPLDLGQNPEGPG